MTGNKAAARFALKNLAESLRDEATLTEFYDDIKNNDEGKMGFVWSVLEAIHDLKDELIAWPETHGNQQKDKARLALQKTAEMFWVEVPEHLGTTMLELWKLTYYGGNRAETGGMINWIVYGVYILRAEIIAGSSVH